MAERTILAYYRTPDQAKAAAERLKALKLVDYRIERFDGYAGTGFQSLDQIGGTIDGNFPGLGYLTMGGDFDGPDAGILIASSVSASGYSSGGPDNRVHGHDILLAAIVEEADYEEADRIVRSSEGVL